MGVINMGKLVSGYQGKFWGEGKRGYEVGAEKLQPGWRSYKVKSWEEPNALYRYIQFQSNTSGAQDDGALLDWVKLVWNSSRGNESHATGVSFALLRHVVSVLRLMAIW